MTRDPDQGRKRPPRRDLWHHGEGAAAARIARGMVVPEGAAGFTLTPEARVFLVGGRFARALAAGLAERGVRVRGTERVAAGAGPAPAARDNPPLIRQELEWAAGQPFAEEALLPLADAWVDPFLPQPVPGVGLAEIRGRRAALARHFAGAFRSDLAVLAPSTAEVWFERPSKLALAGPPHRRIFEADRDRFGVKRLGFDEVAQALKVACLLLRRRAPALKVVLAVSPLPMERTFTGEDVIVANMASKSTLHAAAVALAERNDWIGYFPAWEAAMTSHPGEAWAADRTGLSPALIDSLADAFVRQYGLMLTGESRTAGSA